MVSVCVAFLLVAGIVVGSAGNVILIDLWTTVDSIEQSPMKRLVNCGEAWCWVFGDSCMLPLQLMWLEGSHFLEGTSPM